MPSRLTGSRMVTLMPVRNLDRAIQFYVHTLGGEMGERGQGEMKDSWASVYIARGTIWLVAPEAREKRRLAYTNFLVRDIRKVVRELTRRGVKFEKASRTNPMTKIEGPIAVEPFGASAFFKDPEGNLLMVWQNYPPL